MYTSLMWYDSVASLTAAVQDQLDDMREIDAAIAAKSVFEGYCVHCRHVVDMAVNGGAMFGDDVNLREGLVCQRCGLNARSRQLFITARRLFAAVSGVICEFPGRGGQEDQPRHAVHQDMQALSFADGELDGILHNDVLEHVPDASRALRQCSRVLKEDGILLFNVPWFPWLPQTLVRGRLDVDGVLHEFLPTEMHGDGLRPEGVYTFNSFGADLPELLLDAGFRNVQFGLSYAPYAGMVTNNYRYGDDFLMLPVVVKAVR
ncbi:MAG: methyltransferase domain-containing protein [Stenotrophomonas sp.]|nr:methyltransferase domain-containing protein [Stenotrophomonas sp.]